MIVSEDGEIDQSLFVEITGGRTRARRGCFAEAKNGGQYQYFLVMEGRSSGKAPAIVSIGDQKPSSFHAECQRMVDAVLRLSSD